MNNRDAKRNYQGGVMHNMNSTNSMHADNINNYAYGKANNYDYLFDGRFQKDYPRGNRDNTAEEKTLNFGGPYRNFNEKKRKKNPKKDEAFASGGNLGNMSKLNMNGASNFMSNNMPVNQMNNINAFGQFNKLGEMYPTLNTQNLNNRRAPFTRQDINTFNNNFNGPAENKNKRDYNNTRYQKIPFNSKEKEPERKLRITDKIKISNDIVSQLKSRTTSQILDNINEGGLNSYRTQSTADEDLRSSWGRVSSVTSSIHTPTGPLSAAMPKVNGNFVFPQAMMPNYFTPKNAQIMNLNHGFNSSVATSSMPFAMRNLNKHFTSLKNNNQLQMSSLYKVPDRLKSTKSDKSLVIDKIRTLMEEKIVEKRSCENDNTEKSSNNTTDTMTNSPIENCKNIAPPEVLEVQIKISEGEFKFFKFTEGEDLVKTATAFCSSHEMDPRLITPICRTVSKALESVRSVMDAPVEDVAKLDRAFREFKDFIEDEDSQANLSTLSCVTVFDYSTDEDLSRLNRSL